MRKSDRHHIIPKSRGGSSNPDNMARVSVKKHRVYHELFDNRTPDEIVEYLSRTFWNGEYVYRRI